MSHQTRQSAVEAVARWTPPQASPSAKGRKIEEMFGENVFTLERMQQRLPKGVYKRLMATIHEGEPIDMSIADAVAIAMRDWAVDKGATHYTHWFQPLTGLTAEKHDSFITPTVNGRAVQEFSGKDLIKGEPDASSLPSGGLRTTFEARGYTAWDPTSPAFVVENANGTVLCIPTAFCSYTGEALDKKTPLLRSMAAIHKQTMRALKLFGSDEGVNQVFPTVGPEQEYFLVDSHFYYNRPDLMACGRTLIGAAPPKGQELEDHYFGQIQDRVLAFMIEVELELYRLGVPVQTRHNEVAPGQYEIAPLFENANVANDHQQLMMTMLQRLAPKYGLTVLLHEKPFAGVNGSGKHNNWSLTTDTGMNLLDPGDNPHDNMQFLFFCAAVIRAVYRHGDMLRAAVASAGNDHRLGANEAPPAIISIFLGEQLHEIFRQLEQGKPVASKEEAEAEGEGLLGLGVDVLPALPKDAGDRNRTSPFAFTGNKFEFRGVGSKQSIAGPNVVLNTIVADSIDHMTTELEAAVNKGQELETALRNVLREVMGEAEKVLFDGDSYSEEWHAEAERRGLPNLRDTVAAQPAVIQEHNLEVFDKHGVLSRREMSSRFEIYTEHYTKVLNIEAETTASIARNHVLPAALEYQRRVAESVNATKTAGAESAGAEKLLKDVCALTGQLSDALDALTEINDHETSEDVLEYATFMRDQVLPRMNEARRCCDDLERILPEELWSLPKYPEMLFIK